MQSIKTIAVITAVGILLTAGTVLAKNNIGPMGMGKGKSSATREAFFGQNAEERLAKQVADGKITQEEADEILAECAEKKEEMTVNAKERIASMLSEGKITQEKADEMLKAIDEGKMPFMGRDGRVPFMGREGKMDNKSPEERLAEQVAAGKITQEEADKILAECTERKEEMTAKAKERIASMLSEGKITQEKADEMLKAIDEGKMPFMGRQGRMGKMPPPCGNDSRRCNPDLSENSDL